MTGRRGRNTPQEPVAIIGMGCLFPKADGVESYWANICAGVDAITDVPFTHWRPEDYFDSDPKRPDFTYGRRGGFISPFEFDPLKYGIPPNVIEATDTAQLLAMAVADRALTDAGYGAGTTFDRTRVSVILGVTGALELVIPLGARLGHPIWRKALKESGLDDATIDDAVRRIADGYVDWQEGSFPGLLGNVVAGRVSKHLDLGGTNCVVDAACASSLSAVHLAALELQTGKADMVVSGGVDTFNDIFMYMCFSKTPALSASGNAKPFDHEGDGTILGEGLGMLVLKRLDDAQRDGDRVYAIITGIGSSSDGKGEAIYAPNAAGQQAALREAYENAGVTPDSIELVEAHGTGTKRGDAVEVSALRSVYGERNDRGTWCALGSVKSQIGHTKAAAGAAGLIKAAMALHDKVLPPTIKVERPQEAVAPGETPFYINTVKRPWLGNAAHPRRAGVSSFGFGGSNFHCVLEESSPVKASVTWDPRVTIVALSADSRGALIEKLPDASALEKWDAARAFAMQSRDSFNSSAAHRLLIVLDQHTVDVSRTITSIRAALESTDTGPRMPNGVYYGHGAASGKLAVLFPGQGAQYVGMLRDLACAFPEMLDTLREAEEVYQASPQNAGLFDRIFPHPVFDKDSAKKNEEALRATQVAQPAIGAVSAGALRVLARFGITPEAVAGHSYGELVALHAAGVISAPELFRVSEARGRLMAQGEGDRGSMFAVRAPIAQIETALREEGLDLVIANRNAPDQAVLSGATAEIERAKAAFKKRGMQGTQLPVAAAFHSRFVADASGPFNDELGALEFGPARVPVYSNTTGGVYPNDPENARALLAGQLAKPVEFVREIESMHAVGFSMFVEVGPGARLTGLVRSILEGKPYAAVALDASNGKSNGMADLANALAQIAALGHAIRLAEWDTDFVAPALAKPGRMTVTISGANYRAQRKALPPRTISPALAREEGEAPAAPRAITGDSSSNIRPIRPINPIAPTARSQGPSSPSFDQTQRNIAALRNMQEQTAALHKQFLEGQEKALETFRALVSRQRGITPLAEAPARTADFQAAPASASPASATVPEFDLPADSGPSIAEELAAALKEVVSDKTGYPTNMLELSMTLDSDLGIDSIKRVEILSALQERLPQLPSIEADELGRIQTLQDVVDRLVRDVPAASSGAVATSASSVGVRSKLLQIVSEKTGYPVEMLEPDMALDADLGIDSIKRVEILSALQEAMPNLPQVEPDELGRFVTLADVIARLGQKGASSTHDVPHAVSARATVVSKPATQVTPQASDTSLAERLLQIVSDKTGYPPNMLDLSMSLDADLGIDSIKRVEILSCLQDALPHLPSLDAEAAGRLRTLQDVIDALSQAGAPMSSKAAPKPQYDVLASTSLDRYVVEVSELPLRPDAPSVLLQSDAVFWVGDDGTEFSRAIAAHLRSMEVRAELVTADSVEQLDAASRLDGLVLVAPESAVNAGHVRSAFSLLQHAAKKLRAKSSPTPLLVAVTRMDGAFGLGAGPARSCANSAAFAGLVKTARHEWPEVRCRAIDVGNGYASVDEAAKDVVKEALADGPIETGLDAGRRVALTLAPANALADAPPRFGADDVIVITGGARGVTAECAVALAEAYGCTLALFGRGQASLHEDPSYAGIDEASELKRRILATSGVAMAPKELEAKYREVLAQREIRSTLERIREAGGRPSYYSVDVRDDTAVRDTLARVRKECGPVTGLVHGAGVLADRLIEDKTLDQFDFVFDTKTAGLDNLLGALKKDPLKAIALFSSSTARFGRKGQCDYAAANEVLNKIGQAEARSRPEVRVVSLNWGPWDGGMVTPALRGIFASEGVALIGVREGARLLIAELDAPATRPIEIVVLGGGSRLPNELTQTDAADHSTIRFALSAEAFPFLESHVIDGKAVLPASLYIEWFAHAALHANPGLRFEGIDGLAVLKGVILQPGESRALEFRVGRVRRDGRRTSVAVEFWSTPEDSQAALHAKANVLLSEKLERGQPALAVRDLPAYRSGRDIYGKGRLFHGRHFQGLRDVEGCGEHGIAGVAGSAPRPGEWIAHPMRRSWLTEPLVIDCAFQLMILWSYDQFGHGSLPVRVGRYRQFQRGFPKGPVRIVARITDRSEHKAVSDVEFLDAGAGTLLARIEDYECVIDGALDRAFANNIIAGTTA